jgi:hypothetical protein
MQMSGHHGVLLSSPRSVKQAKEGYVGADESVPEYIIFLR